ncbi:MAG TPA: NADH-quinone oxidoreductase subunit C/D [Methylothermaceae bacterium]|nr:NADH-quinone oxidoreductase subunit C/D [Methylothermaceae bacterium]
MNADPLSELKARFGPESIQSQASADAIPTLWLAQEKIVGALSYLKRDLPAPYRMLFDLTAVDERWRRHREGLPEADFSVVYLLYSFDRCNFLRLKVPLTGEEPELPSVTPVWPAANWYEREVWDLFGIRFRGHPDLRRILLPPFWEGHPLRKDHHARATEVGRFHLSEEEQWSEQQSLRFDPAEWGFEQPGDEDFDYLFLNVGPNHPSTHGVFRVALQLVGEVIVDAVPDIGYHHRGAEKMGERQSWHSYIPYTDRIDYLGGALNNLPYVMALEQLAGIEVPPRAQMIRVMLSELYRIASHLLFYGTFAQDLGQLAPIFYMFTDREKVFDITQAISGARMHASYFRIGGVAWDLPKGWQRLLTDLLDWMPRRLDEYDKLVLDNAILKRRTRGIGAYDTRDAIDWGVTGPGLRATGLAWDLRKVRPYSGYDQFEFDIPTGNHGDCYDRCRVRAEEIRQSIRILRQCLDHMPEGPYKANHPLAVPPPKDRTLHDIETLIQHFLSVSWGPVMPVGETFAVVEATKGWNGYYLISDGNTMSYRTRIRTPSFPHLQMIPKLARGMMIADLVAILASIDYVMADVDR